jgi:oligoribonuclease
MRYLSIDVETTGLDPNNCDLIEIACVLEDTSLKPLPPVEELPSFACVVKRSEYVWEAGAMALHKDRLLPALLLAEVQGLQSVGSIPIRSYESMCWALNDFLQYFDIAPNNKITPAGKNFAGFDARFIPADLAACLRKRTLDPGSVLVDWTKDRLPSLKDLLEKEPQHAALADAQDVVSVLRRSYQ